MRNSIGIKINWFQDKVLKQKKSKTHQKTKQVKELTRKQKTN